MAFEVLDPGPLTTIQDGGRPGFGRYGVPEGGVLDRERMWLANLAVGNEPGAPVLEFTAASPRLRHVRGRPLATATAGDTLEVTVAGDGAVVDARVLKACARGVIAVSGGFRGTAVMGSQATCLAAGFGGHDGRALREGDRVPTGPNGSPQAAPRPSGLPAPRLPGGSDPTVLRVTAYPGREEPARALCAAAWRAGPGDRTGLRLVGEALAAPVAGMSVGLPPGAIEVTGGGQPIILLRDHPTMGGYPVVATLVEVDLDLAAQVRPGAGIRFETIDVAEAVRLRLDRDAAWKAIRESAAASPGTS